MLLASGNGLCQYPQAVYLEVIKQILTAQLLPYQLECSVLSLNPILCMFLHFGRACQTVVVR